MRKLQRTNRRDLRLIAFFLALLWLTAFVTPVTIRATPTDPNLLEELAEKRLQSPIVGIYYVP